MLVVVVGCAVVVACYVGCVLLFVAVAVTVC